MTAVFEIGDIYGNSMRWNFEQAFGIRRYQNKEEMVGYRIR